MDLKNSSSYPFTVGKIDCRVVDDGTLTYLSPAEDLFANAPADQLAQALLRHNLQIDLWKEWISPLSCLVIQAGDHRLFVDTGLGKVDFAPNAGKLIQNMQAEGIQPGDIDTVVLTHAHGDHIGWNAGPDGRATFPNARYVMRKEEWDFWTSAATLAQPEYEWMTPFVNRQLLPLSDRFELLEQDAELAPGIHTLLAPGHTPGHMALVIASEGEKLLVVGDMIAHPIHLEQPDWHIAPDCHPDQAVRTKRRLLELAAVEQARVFAFHFDFPGLGYVRPHQGAWHWQAG